jgi:DNA-binding SARP family transcriptional activator
VEAPVEFRILGPLDVAYDGGPPLPLPGPGQGNIVAILLLHANEEVPTERLVEHLWPESPPKPAAHRLQVSVSRIRRSLIWAEKRLLTPHPGFYTLVVKPGELDAEHCERLHGQARAALAADDPARAGELLGHALSLWRGRPLAGLNYGSWAGPAVERLLELQASCLEDRVEAWLALGRHADAVPAIRALIHEQPYRERPRGQLMLALYRAGRQAEALEAFQETRRRLVDELGIEPSAALRDLHSSILRQDPELLLEPPAPVEAAAPAAPPEHTMTRKTAAVMAILLRSAASDAEVQWRLLEQAGAHVRAVIEDHHGTFFAGPAADHLAVFGIPVADEEDVLRALHAATALGARVAERTGGRLAAAIAIDTGLVAASTGDGRTSVAGEPVGRAAALAARASPGDVLLSEAARRLAPDAILVEPVAGGGDWRLLELIPGAPAVRRDLTAPMVGRDRELAGAVEAFERAELAGETRLLAVLGDAGLGKSRLAQELIGRLEPHGTVVVGRCLSYGDGIAFWPLREALLRLTGEGSRGSIRSLLGDAPDAELVADVAAVALGLAGRAGSGEQVPWAFRRLFEELAAARPVLLVIEDAHWAEPPLLELLDHLVDWMTTSPMLVLCVARPEPGEVSARWAGHPRASSIVLEPLDPEQALQLLENGAGDEALDAEAARRILAAAGGVPLFVEQLLALHGEDPRWNEARRIPTSVEALLNARLDRLAPGERACIQRAAVIGREFSVEAVLELLEPDARAFAQRHLRSLVHRGLLRPSGRSPGGGDQLGFHHILIQDVAYENVPLDLRADLHERFGTWLERRYEGLDEFVGYHLAQAFESRHRLQPADAGMLELAARAADRLAAGARRALFRGETGALSLFERAAALLAVSGVRRPGILLELGGALSESGRFDDAERVLDETIRQAAELGDEALSARAQVELDYRHRLVDPSARLDDMLVVADHAIEVFRRASDEVGLARALVHKGHVHWTRCAAGEMERELEQALVHAERAGDERQRLDILSWLARATMMGPRHADDGVERCHRILAQANDDDMLVAVTEATLAVLEAMRGRYDEARGYWRDSRARLERVGLTVTLASLRMYSGFVELMAGTPERAEEELMDAYAVLRDIGDHHRLPTLEAVLARLVYAEGRAADADRFARAAEEAAAKDDVVTHVLWRGTAAKVLARNGHAGPALACAREAVELAETTDFLLLRADAVADRADVQAVAGQIPAAVEDLERAISLYRRKGARSGEDAARRFRSQLLEATNAPVFNP